MNVESIKLFKSVLITEKKELEIPKEVFERIIPFGYIITPEVMYNYSCFNLYPLLKNIEKEIGLSKIQINNSFHKSWKKIEESDRCKLVIQQILHYFTTYGFKQLGIYDKDLVYIPNEVLDIPDIDIDKFNLVVIKGITKPELKEKVLDLLNTGIALHKDTLKDLITIVLECDISSKEIENIKNKESRIMLYRYLDILPENPLEFLRYCIYIATNSSLLIKSNEVINAIKYRDNFDIEILFTKYKLQYGFDKLSQIFLRFKLLFLAFRTTDKLKTYTNKLRKLANKNHKPMKEDFLNGITKQVKNGFVDFSKMENELKKVNIFRKIRLAYALNYRTFENDSILYRIRNGKSFVKDFEFEKHSLAKKVLNVILDSISSDLKPKLEGKKICIPDNMIYTLPATEKQFTGCFPSGSYIKIPYNMICGVHWFNQNGNSIDLDLSLINSENGKVGWDSNYKTDDKTILFSGDLTDAPKPNGASELFNINNSKEQNYIVFLNYYNYNSSINVPFKIVVAKHDFNNKENFIIDLNSIEIRVDSLIDKRQKILGMITVKDKECRFYFVETSIGNRISSDVNTFTLQSLKYIENYYKDSIKFEDVLKKSGVIIVRDENEDFDIDFSPNVIEKDTIINLLKK